MRVEYSKRAIADLQKIAVYYEDDANQSGHDRKQIAMTKDQV
jgi:hypothetical protein